MFDDDIQELIAAWLASGTIRPFDDGQPVFDTIERQFPIGLNRIAWEKVSSKQREEIFPVASGGKQPEDVERRLGACRERVASWLRTDGVALDAEIVWVGDNTDGGLSMTVETMLACFPKLFSLPQHAYVLPLDGAWCLNYVMEGELFYARAPRTGDGPK